MAKVAYLALAFLALAVAERSCMRKPDFMKHEHFAAFTEVDTNGDLTLSPAEIESSAAGDEDMTRSMMSLLELSDKDGNGKLSMNEFHHMLKMDLSEDPETRQKQLVGINDGNYPTHPVFLQLAEHLWSTSQAMQVATPKTTDADATSDTAAKPGNVLAGKKTWFTTLWNFMKTPACYLKHCGKGIIEHIYLGMGYGMAWAIEPAVKFNIKVRVSPANLVAKLCKQEDIQKCIGPKDGASDAMAQADPANLPQGEEDPAKAEALDAGSTMEEEKATETAKNPAATFVQVSQDEHQSNLGKLEQALKEVGYSHEQDPMHGHLGVDDISDHGTQGLRHMAPDHLKVLLKPLTAEEEKEHDAILSAFVEEHAEALRAGKNSKAAEATDKAAKTAEAKQAVIKAVKNEVGILTAEEEAAKKAKAEVDGVKTEGTLNRKQFFARCLTNDPCKNCGIGFTVNIGIKLPFASPSLSFTFNFGPMSWVQGGTVKVNKCVTMCPACAMNRIPVIGRLVGPMLKISMYDLSKLTDPATAVAGALAGPCFFIPLKVLPAIVKSANQPSQIKARLAGQKQAGYGLAVTFTETGKVMCGISCAPILTCFKGWFKSAKATFWDSGANDKDVVKKNLKTAHVMYNRNHPCTPVSEEVTDAEVEAEGKAAKAAQASSSVKGVSAELDSEAEKDEENDPLLSAPEKTALKEEVKKAPKCDKDTLSEIKECGKCKTIIGIAFEQVPISWGSFGNGFFIGPMGKCLPCAYRLLMRQVSTAGKAIMGTGAGKKMSELWKQKKAFFEKSMAAQTVGLLVKKLDSCEKSAVAMCILIADSRMCRATMSRGVALTKNIYKKTGGEVVGSELDRLTVFQASNVLQGMGFEHEARMCRSAASGSVKAKSESSLGKGLAALKAKALALKESLSSNKEEKDVTALTEEQAEIRDKCTWPWSNKKPFSICEMWKNPTDKKETEKTKQKLDNGEFAPTEITLDNGEFAAPRHLCEAVEQMLDAKSVDFGEGGDVSNLPRKQCMKLCNCDDAAASNSFGGDALAVASSSETSTLLQTHYDDIATMPRWRTRSPNPASRVNSPHIIDSNTGLSHFEIMETLKTYSDWLELSHTQSKKDEKETKEAQAVGYTAPNKPDDTTAKDTTAAVVTAEQGHDADPGLPTDKASSECSGLPAGENPKKKIEEVEKLTEAQDQDRINYVSKNQYTCPLDYGDELPNIPIGTKTTGKWSEFDLARGFAGSVDVSFPTSKVEGEVGMPTGPLPPDTQAALAFFDIKMPLYDLFYSRAGCNTGKRTSPSNSWERDLAAASSSSVPVAFDADKEFNEFDKKPLADIKIDGNDITTTDDFVKYCLGIDYSNELLKVPRIAVEEGGNEPGEMDKEKAKELVKPDLKETAASFFKTWDQTNQRPHIALQKTDSTPRHALRIRQWAPWKKHRKMLGSYNSPGSAYQIKTCPKKDTKPGPNTYFSPEQLKCIEAMKTKVMRVLNDYTTTGVYCEALPKPREFTEKCGDKASCADCTGSKNNQNVACAWCGPKGETGKCDTEGSHCSVVGGRIRSPSSCAMTPDLKAASEEETVSLTPATPEQKPKGAGEDEDKEDSPKDSPTK